jgi:hypothetical protein
VRRARSDGVWGWFLVPNSSRAGFRQCLTREATALFFYIVNGNAFEHADARRMGRHSLFFVDFAEAADNCSPPCCWARLHQPRSNDFKRCEEVELAQLQRHILDSGTPEAVDADGGPDRIALRGGAGRYV